MTSSGNPHQEDEPVGLRVIGEAVADLPLVVAAAPLAAVGPEQVVLFRPPASGSQELVEGVDVINNVVVVCGRISLNYAGPVTLVMSQKQVSKAMGQV